MVDIAFDIFEQEDLVAAHGIPRDRFRELLKRCVRPLQNHDNLKNK